VSDISLSFQCIGRCYLASHSYSDCFAVLGVAKRLYAFPLHRWSSIHFLSFYCARKSGLWGWADDTQVPMDILREIWPVETILD
jgi:hypothetical protein